MIGIFELVVLETFPLDDSEKDLRIGVLGVEVLGTEVLSSNRIHDCKWDNNDSKYTKKINRQVSYI